ncbi:MAG: hypothetical protein MHM6MM_004755 [Cercozoa sp. M6MM]
MVVRLALLACLLPSLTLALWHLQDRQVFISDEDTKFRFTFRFPELWGQPECLDGSDGDKVRVSSRVGGRDEEKRTVNPVWDGSAWVGELERWFDDTGDYDLELRWKCIAGSKRSAWSLWFSPDPDPITVSMPPPPTPALDFSLDDQDNVIWTASWQRNGANTFQNHFENYRLRIYSGDGSQELESVDIGDRNTLSHSFYRGETCLRLSVQTRYYDFPDGGESDKTGKVCANLLLFGADIQRHSDNDHKRLLNLTAKMLPNTAPSSVLIDWKPEAAAAISTLSVDASSFSSDGSGLLNVTGLTFALTAPGCVTAVRLALPSSDTSAPFVIENQPHQCVRTATVSAVELSFDPEDAVRANWTIDSLNDIQGGPYMWLVKLFDADNAILSSNPTPGVELSTALSQLGQFTADTVVLHAELWVSTPALGDSLVATFGNVTLTAPQSTVSVTLSGTSAREVTLALGAYGDVTPRPTRATVRTATGTVVSVTDFDSSARTAWVTQARDLVFLVSERGDSGLIVSLSHPSWPASFDLSQSVTVSLTAPSLPTNVEVLPYASGNISVQFDAPVIGDAFSNEVQVRVRVLDHTDLSELSSATIATGALSGNASIGVNANDLASLCFKTEVRVISGFTATADDTAVSDGYYCMRAPKMPGVPVAQRFGTNFFAQWQQPSELPDGSVGVPLLPVMSFELTLRNTENNAEETPPLVVVANETDYESFLAFPAWDCSNLIITWLTPLPTVNDTAYTAPVCQNGPPPFAPPTISVEGTAADPTIRVAWQQPTSSELNDETLRKFMIKSIEPSGIMDASLELDKTVTSMTWTLQEDWMTRVPCALFFVAALTDGATYYSGLSEYICVREPPAPSAPVLSLNAEGDRILVEFARSPDTGYTILPLASQQVSLGMHTQSVAVADTTKSLYLSDVISDNLNALTRCLTATITLTNAADSSLSPSTEICLNALSWQRPLTQSDALQIEPLYETDQSLVSGGISTEARVRLSWPQLKADATEVPPFGFAVLNMSLTAPYTVPWNEAPVLATDSSPVVAEVDSTLKVSTSTTTLETVVTLAHDECYLLGVRGIAAVAGTKSWWLHSETLGALENNDLQRFCTPAYIPPPDYRALRAVYYFDKLPQENEYRVDQWVFRDALREDLHSWTDAVDGQVKIVDVNLEFEDTKVRSEVHIETKATVSEAYEHPYAIMDQVVYQARNGDFDQDSTMVLWALDVSRLPTVTSYVDAAFGDEPTRPADPVTKEEGGFPWWVLGLLAGILILLFLLYRCVKRAHKQRDGINEMASFYTQQEDGVAEDVDIKPATIRRDGQAGATTTAEMTNM